MTQAHTVSGILAGAIGIEPLTEAAVPAPAGVCAMGNCGRPITHGYPVAALTGPATNEFLDCFRGGLRGHVCPTCAGVFKAQVPSDDYRMGRAWIAFAGGPAYDPLLSRESAADKERPCWADVLRAVWPAQRGKACVILLTTDGKRRIWPGARAGALGERTPIYYHNNKASMGVTGSRVLTVSWPALLECLDLVERAYAAGFAKTVIRDGILSQFAAAQALGMRESISLERELAPWRERPEFAVALLTATRPADWKKPSPRAKAAPQPEPKPEPASADRQLSLL